MRSRALLFCLAILVATDGFAQTYEGGELVEADLLADRATVAPGESLTVGVRIKIADGWHTYWKYSGDSGMATRIEWDLPPGFSAGPLQWPVPERLVEPGDIVTYGYSEEVMLLATVQVPARIEGGQVTIKASANWLVCEKLCIPGSAPDLELVLPVAAESIAANEEIFGKYRSAVPSRDPPSFSVGWEQEPGGWLVRLRGIEDGASLEFFPLPPEKTTIGHSVLERSGSGATVHIPHVGGGRVAMAGVIAVGEGPDRRAWEVNSGSEGLVPEAVADAPLSAIPLPPGLTLWAALAFGIVGGFILNLMPCVLPVIALKIFGFINQAGQSRARARGLGLAFVAGIFVWFLAIALLITGFRVAGRDLNWAFQFQNPIFVLSMMVLLFAFALNLLGVFEVMLPGGATTNLTELSSREGYGGAFLHGVLATLLATPCTAPFLGPALGFAFSQQAVVIFAIFFAIAAGMSLPYILLSLQPGWIRFLPKPGPWMETVKQAMGFLLLATVLFLLWVLGRQRGVDAMAWAAVVLLIVGIAGWLLGRILRRRGLALTAALVLIGGGFALGAMQVTRLEPVEGGGAAMRAGGMPWEPFTRETLEAAREDGRLIFIDFTADWCVNCKWNERFVIESAPVIKAFREAEVLAMKADWTSGDPEITALLKSFGRAGVPLYVFYPKGRGSAPLILPEILTKELLLEKLQIARGDTST